MRGPASFVEGPRCLQGCLVGGPRYQQWCFAGGPRFSASGVLPEGSGVRIRGVAYFGGKQRWE